MSSPVALGRLLRSLALFAAVSLAAGFLFFCATKMWPDVFSRHEKVPALEGEGPVVNFVVLDAGHGGMDTGTSAQGMHEKDGTLDITQRVAGRLSALGVKTVLTRSKDHYLELDERVVPTTRRGAMAFVSIHLNSSKVKAVQGVETYFSSQRKMLDAAALRKNLQLGDGAEMEDHRSELLAGLIQRNVAAATGAPDRGVRDSRLHVARNSNCPAVLVECGYLTNKDEALRLKRSAYKDKIATAIAESIHEYLKKISDDPRRGLVITPRPPVEVTVAQP